MRVDVKKYLFMGSKKDKEHFFQEAQKMGIVEFINPQGKRRVPLSKEAEKFQAAIKVLRSHVLGDQEIKKDIPLAQKIAQEILDAKTAIDKAEDEKIQVEQEIAKLLPFGDFSMKEIEAIAKESSRKIYFYCAKSSKQLENADEELILINSVDGIDYFISITDEPIKHPDLFLVHLTESLSELNQKLARLENTIATYDDRIKSLTKYNWLMHYALVHEVNKLSFEFANESVNLVLDDTLFAIEGWVPENKQKALFELTSKLNIVSEEVFIEEDQVIPTYLENKKLARVGEDLVDVFDVPSHTDKDPSIWVLIAFSLFFAMIVGDGGYGLIFLATALILQWKIKNLKGLGKRLLKLVTILGCTCVLWGFLMNSFFGITFNQNGFFRQNSLINWMVEKKAAYHMAQKDDVYVYWIKKYPVLAKAKTPAEFIEQGDIVGTLEKPGAKFADNIAFELALLIGSIHIILGMARYIKRRPAGAGWIIFVIGAYLYMPIYLNATSIIHFCFGVDKVKGAEFGLHMLCAGAGLAVIIAVIHGGIRNIIEILTSIQILSDVLSYLRIYALGLAGSIVSATVNELGGGLPLFIAIIVIVIAHTINIALSIMGGVIHGLRLNYLEWYHYSFDGGGKKFQPLKLHIFE